MVDAPAKRKKKGEIGEEDVYILLQRYKPEQVLALLREVSQSPDVKIDWNSVVKKPQIEITSARECQMLWRHLAYLQPLSDEIEYGAPPLDDDSDLEYELEASPPVSTEFAMEVANCVKVLASGSPSESSMPNSSVVKGDMPNGHSSKASSEIRHRTSFLHSTNITPPVSLQKQPQDAGPSSEAIDANGLDNSRYPPRRKRKHWSYEEDLELIAAVKKFGEGNWANIVKGEFKGDRSASQLSQRWAIIRKKEGRLIMGGMSSQLSEAQLATRRAIDMALKDNLTGGSGTAGNGGAATTSDHAKLNASNGDTPTAGNTVSSQPQNSQVTNATSVKPGPVGVAKPRLPLNKAPTNTIPSVNDPIQAAAVAAGARIVSCSNAATLFNAKNAVHIRGRSSIKSSATGSSPLPPNVHFICTGLVGTSATSMGAGPSPHPLGGGHQTKVSSVKPPVSRVPKATAVPPAALDRRNSAPSSISASEPQQMANKTLSQVKVPVSDLKPVAGQEDDASHSRCLPKAPGTHSDPGKQTVGDADSSQCAMSKDTTESECKNPLDKEKQSTIQGSCDTSVNGSDRVVTGASSEKMVSGEADKSNQMDL